MLREAVIVQPAIVGSISSFNVFQKSRLVRQDDWPKARETCILHAWFVRQDDWPQAHERGQFHCLASAGSPARSIHCLGSAGRTDRA
jgi:hypothetical protein